MDAPGLHATGRTRFTLPHPFASDRGAVHLPFVAYFTLESPSELAVAPAAGFLELPGQQPPPLGVDAAAAAGGGASLTIAFTPHEYGRQYVGRLVIDTPEIQVRER